MNVRITHRENLQRTDLYSGVQRVSSTGAQLYLWWMLDDDNGPDFEVFPLSTIAEIQLDDLPGDWW